MNTPLRTLLRTGVSFAAAWLTLQTLAPERASLAEPGCTNPPIVRVVRWQHGDPTLRLLPADRGFCYVSGLGGALEGGGEGVRVFVDDGTWFVGGYSCQPSLWVEVTCVAWPARAGRGHADVVAGGARDLSARTAARAPDASSVPVRVDATGRFRELCPDPM